ncbi:hypothetical protein Hanom_Chr17g01587231 [Helianthus anomalus]
MSKIKNRGWFLPEICQTKTGTAGPRHGPPDRVSDRWSASPISLYLLDLSIYSVR